MSASTDNSWLVIIDMQNIFGTPSQYWWCPNFAEIIAPIQNLAAQFPGRTLLTRFVAASDPQGSWVPYYQEFPFAEVPPTNPLYDIVTQLQSLIDPQNVVTMTTFGKWQGLSAITGPYPQLYLTGVATDCCVLSTAMQAAEAGAFVTVVMDACAGSSATNQVAAQNILIGYSPLIQITTSEELLKR
jgi:nicotinamidase-related amidase